MNTLKIKWIKKAPLVCEEKTIVFSKWKLCRNNISLFVHFIPHSCLSFSSDLLWIIIFNVSCLCKQKKNIYSDFPTWIMKKMFFREGRFRRGNPWKRRYAGKMFYLEHLLFIWLFRIVSFSYPPITIWSYVIAFPFYFKNLHRTRTHVKTTTQSN